MISSDKIMPVSSSAAAAAMLIAILQVSIPTCLGQIGISSSSCSSSSSSLSAEACKNISRACAAARFFELCNEYAVESPEIAAAARDPAEFVKLAIALAYREMNSTLEQVDQLSYSTHRRQLVVEDTRELLGSSLQVLMQSMRTDIRDNSSLSDVRHLLSAALTYSNDGHDYLFSCSSFAVAKYIQMYTIPLVSNALWILDAFETGGNDFKSWRQTPKSSRVNARSTAASSDADANRLFQLEVSVASAVVSLDPSYGSHVSIQAAVDDAPEHLARRYTIYIRAGIYDEIVRIPSTKTMIAFLGDGINQTIITGNLSTVMGLSTYRTPTLAISGNGFLMRDITVVNTAGTGGQAVAMRADSDMAGFHRCSFWGFQDTLYTHAYRQFYRDCFVYGTIDFIFGNAASIFQNCNIQIRPGAPNHTISTVTAQGRTDPEQDTAFVCQSCLITGTPEYIQAYLALPRKHLAYLGRPWKPYARAIFIESFIDLVIDPSGWMPWDDDTPENALLAEFRDYGPGANPSSRVDWSKQLTTISALEYSVRGLIQGGYWLPFTGIPYRLVF